LLFVKGLETDQNS